MKSPNIDPPHAGPPPLPGITTEEVAKRAYQIYTLGAAAPPWGELPVADQERWFSVAKEIGHVLAGHTLIP